MCTRREEEEEFLGMQDVSLIVVPCGYGMTKKAKKAIAV